MAQTFTLEVFSESANKRLVDECLEAVAAVLQKEDKKFFVQTPVQKNLRVEANA